jgi:outer membrane protein with beta-barrel domain
MTRRLILMTLTAVLLAVPGVRAEEQASLGFGIGLVRPTDVDSTYWVTANYRFRVTDRVSVEPEVGFWSKSNDVPGFDVTVEDLSFGANAILEWGGSGSGDLQPWVGAGLGLHRLKGVADVGDVELGGTQSKLGVHLLGGADYGLSETFDVFAAARYDIVSHANQFKLYGGLRYKF